MEVTNLESRRHCREARSFRFLLEVCDKRTELDLTLPAKLSISYYSPSNATPRPQAKTVLPAAACPKRSKRLKFSFFKPCTDAKTTTIIVNTVTRPNTALTMRTPLRLSRAAGYINRGISGSQGPNTKMMKITQGVSDFESALFSCR